MVGEGLHAPAPRRWSKASSELTRPTTAAQVKARLNISSPLQASLNVLVAYIQDLDSILDLRRRGREAPPAVVMSAVLVLCSIWLIYIISVHVILYMIPYARLWLFLGGLVMLWFVLTYRAEGPGRDEIEEEAKRDQLRVFESLLVETLKHRQLEILCRYGDYLAERLGSLRQHISEKGLETKHNFQLAEYWTDTSAILKQEEGQEDTPCHNLISAAAKGLNWNQETIIFTVHEYAKRNSLMHADLFDLVESKNWPAIGKRCKDDIEKLRELFVESDANSRVTIERWVEVIEEFRDRWVRPSEDSDTWEARTIILEAIAVGLNDQSSLSKLAMLPKTATPAECATKIQTIKTENALGNKHRNTARRLADVKLQADNKLLKEEAEQLKALCMLKGGTEDFVARLTLQIKRNDELEKESKRCQNTITQLKERCEKSQKQEINLKKQIKEQMRNHSEDFEVDMNLSHAFEE